MLGGRMADQGCHGKLTCNRAVTGCHRLSQAVTAVTAVTRCHMLSHAVTGLRMLPLQGEGHSWPARQRRSRLSRLSRLFRLSRPFRLLNARSTTKITI